MSFLFCCETSLDIRFDKFLSLLMALKLTMDFCHTIELLSFMNVVRIVKKIICTLEVIVSMA